MTSPTAISTAGLTKHYPGVQALTDLTLDVPAGSIYGFLGPNGAGKSTTLKILGGLIRPTAGTASVAGIPLSDGSAYRQQVGYLAQDPRFYDWMTGRETLQFVASLSPDPTTSDPPGSTSPWPGSDSPTPPTDGRRRTRAACARGSASPRP